MRVINTYFNEAIHTDAQIEAHHLNAAGEYEVEEAVLHHLDPRAQLLSDATMAIVQAYFDGDIDEASYAAIRQGQLFRRIPHWAAELKALSHDVRRVK